MTFQWIHETRHLYSSRNDKSYLESIWKFGSAGKMSESRLMNGIRVAKRRQVWNRKQAYGRWIAISQSPRSRLVRSPDTRLYSATRLRIQSHPELGISRSRAMDWEHTQRHKGPHFTTTRTPYANSITKAQSFL